jgi:hypothetical protein
MTPQFLSRRNRHKTAAHMSSAHNYFRTRLNRSALPRSEMIVHRARVPLSFVLLPPNQELRDHTTLQSTFPRRMRAQPTGTSVVTVHVLRLQFSPRYRDVVCAAI